MQEKQGKLFQESVLSVHGTTITYDWQESTRLLINQEKEVMFIPDSQAVNKNCQRLTNNTNIGCYTVLIIGIQRN